MVTLKNRISTNKWAFVLVTLPNCGCRYYLLCDRIFGSFDRNTLYVCLLTSGTRDFKFRSKFLFTNKHSEPLSEIEHLDAIFDNCKISLELLWERFYQSWSLVGIALAFAYFAGAN
ncbi:hypothetical protein T4D_15651 [Trichinella pseudospiralis]|uniref:Uncharacterized protein n=1 Tax=Trichinella pseudospiralis TaxID=6337 RepID=A0A0V1FD03_TRIPS|nr:hypothetical protein T4D_15651 [Trichinella pseudospiralis]